MDVVTTPISNNFSPDSLPIITDTTVFDVGMNVNLFDTSGIQTIEVKIGSTQGGSDLINQTFVFDVSGPLGNGRYYLRDLYHVQLGLGQFSNFTDYFAEVRIQWVDNSYSPTVIFNR